MLELAEMRPSGQEIVMASLECLAEDTPRNLQFCQPGDQDKIIIFTLLHRVTAFIQISSIRANAVCVRCRSFPYRTVCLSP